ncbi:hypothetical protein NUW58_g505 [Xylaria curta]|uniref:Uncharacterized protein n=1 Tax=Xylaria curta TaxID=42375 RepID=A0ACC1PRJ4_9PEZI|nr:hypothetical protein NUW58_g505 [Xylaria curta]
MTESKSRYGVPTSPWAERYGVIRDLQASLIQDGVQHSGLAPIHPRLDPKYYDDEPPEDEFEIAETMEAMDKVMVTEAYQRIMLQGLASWDMSSLNGILSWDGCPTLLGGHRPDDDENSSKLFEDYCKQRIDVDEDTWLPFFRKDRWYDLDLSVISPGKEEDIIREADGTERVVTRWSVDDDSVWHHLRFSIEIANRILLALIQDNNEWLEMLLYGRIQLWYELFGDPSNFEKHRKNKEDKRILLPFAEVKNIHARKKRKYIGGDGEPDKQKRLHFLNELLENLTWGFLPSRTAARGNTATIDPSIHHIMFQYLPASLWWRLQSKAFWDSGPDGKTGFLFPRIFTNTEEPAGEDKGKGKKWENITVDPSGAGGHRFGHIVDRWNQRRTLWASRRPWYHEAYDIWSTTAILALSRYMAEIMLKDDWDPQSWLPSFPFEVPAYDPTQFQQWNMALKEWEDVSDDATMGGT